MKITGHTLLLEPGSIIKIDDIDISDIKLQ